MSKLILHIFGLPDAVALAYVQAVVDGGKVSGWGVRKQYCYHTVFHSGVEVSCMLLKSGTHTFYVRKGKR